MIGRLDVLIKEKLGFTDQEMSRTELWCSEKIERCTEDFIANLLYKKSPLKRNNIAATHIILHSLYYNNELARPFLVKCILDQNIITEIIEEDFIRKVIEDVNQHNNDVLKNKDLELILQKNCSEMFRTDVIENLPCVHDIKSKLNQVKSVIETIKSHETQLKEYLNSDMSDVYIILDFLQEHYSNILKDNVYKIVQVKLINLLDSHNGITKDRYLSIVDNTNKYNKKVAWISCPLLGISGTV
ncbi:MAG: hypothetical protein U0X86_000145 [Wolbachia endosymbiont of Xenopsylla cheopis]